MNKRNKSLIALLLVLCVGLVGLTIAYFSNSDTIENQFITKEYGSTYTEEFVSPDNWLPGDTTDKTVVVENTGEVDEAVRISYTESWTTHNNGTLNGWIHPDGTKSTHTTETELSTDESVAILNLANTSDWTKVGDYYYYNYKLAPGESTSSFLESVTFNSKTKLDDTCVTTIDGSTKTVTCNSSGDDYDNATYTLTFTIETVQYNKYSEAWGISATIVAEKQVSETFAQHIISNANEASITNYTDGVTSEAYTFNHEATEQTGALTDYRYIGNTPNNYVYFNCTDESDTSTCETWRIIGVFNVDDGTGTFENRVKLVRGSSFADEMAWDTRANSNYNNIDGLNDWPGSDLNIYLNGQYFNSLSNTSQSLIDNVKYYIGGLPEGTDYPYYGTTSSIYSSERGNKVFENHSINWIGKIALMYVSDEYMVYANLVDEICYEFPDKCGATWLDEYGIATESWIYNTNKRDGNQTSNGNWTITPRQSDNHFIITIEGNFGMIYPMLGEAQYNNAVRPVLYLKSNTYIVDGDGSSTTPYKIELR